MVGSARLAERRLTTLFQEFGAARLLAAIEAMLDATERRTRAVVAAWRDGVYEGHATLDDDGHGREDIVIRARVTKSGSDLTVDLTASDPQSTSFVNSSHANMQSAVAMAFAYLIDADIPKNDGVFRVLKVIAKPGTVVWANEGAPVTLCTSHCSNEIVEAIITALADACPDRAMAGWGRRFRIAIAGTDPRTRRKFIWHLFHARPGGGASPAGDGWPSGGEWHSVGGIKFGSVEVAEARFPLHFIRHELRPDSGGAGQYRGGAGAELELAIETAEVAVAKYRRRRRAPWLARSRRRPRRQASHLCPSFEIGQRSPAAHQGGRREAFAGRRPCGSFQRRRRLGRSGAAQRRAACGGSPSGLSTDTTDRA